MTTKERVFHVTGVYNANISSNEKELGEIE